MFGCNMSYMQGTDILYRVRVFLRVVCELHVDRKTNNAHNTYGAVQEKIGLLLFKFNSFWIQDSALIAIHINGKHLFLLVVLHKPKFLLHCPIYSIPCA